MAKAMVRSKTKSRAVARPRKGVARMATKRRSRRGASRRVSAVSLKRMAPQALMGGVVGAIGAIGTGILLAKIGEKMPANKLLSDPAGRAAAASAVSIVLGFVVAKYAKKPAIGAGMATGGAAVGIYALAKPHVEKALSVSLEGNTQSLLSSDLLGRFYSAGPNFQRPSAMNPRNIPAPRR